MKKWKLKALICSILFLVAFGVIVSNVGAAEQAEAANNYNSTIISTFEKDSALNDAYNNRGALPSKFHLKDYVNIETYNQGGFGTCYAQAVAQTVNISYEYQTKEHIRLSALALALQIADIPYGSGASNEDVLDATFSMSYVSEFDFPYSESINYDNSLLLDGDVIDYDFEANKAIDVGHYSLFPIPDDYFSSLTTANKKIYLETMKSYITKYGALCVSLFFQYGTDTNGEYYIKRNASSGAHAVTIVGYDDTYSRNNFDVAASQDGAFIILNSWGEFSIKYAYLSYDDVSILYQIFGVSDFFDDYASDDDINRYCNFKNEDARYNRSSTSSTYHNNSTTTIGYKLEAPEEDKTLLGIDLKPLTGLYSVEYNMTSFPIDIYINPTDDNLNGTFQHIGKYDINIACNKIRFANPIEISNDYAIKLIYQNINLGQWVNDDTLNFPTYFYNGGVWNKYIYSSGTTKLENLCRVCFAVGLNYGDNKYYISHADNNYQYIDDYSTVSYVINSDISIANVNVEVYKYDSITLNTITPSYSHEIQEVNDIFSVSYFNNVVNLTPVRECHGTFKVLISVNNGDAIFEKYITINDTIVLHELCIFAIKTTSTSTYYLLDSALYADYIIIETDETNIRSKLTMRTSEGTTYSSKIANSDYIFTFKNSQKTHSRTLIIRQVLKETALNIEYATYIPDVTNPNPVQISTSGGVLTLADASAPNATFLGWYLDDDYTSQITSIDPTNYGTKLTIYAKWQMAMEGATFDVEYDETTKYLYIHIDFTNCNIDTYNSIQITNIYVNNARLCYFGMMIKSRKFTEKIYYNSLPDNIKFDFIVRREPVSRFKYGTFVYYEMQQTISKTIEAYQVNIVKNADYGTISTSTISVKKGTTIVEDSQNLKIGSHTITANPYTGNADVTYMFNGWTYSDNVVRSNVVITANFSISSEEYTIRFVNYDDSELQTLSLKYGDIPTYTGAIPTRSETDQYVYEFDGWDRTISSVTGDATYKAKFKAVLKKYEVRFVNYDGTLLQSSQVGYGTKPVYNGFIPIKESSERYDYVFAGWNKEIENVTGNAIYIAQFTEVIKTYTVNFYDDDSNLLSTIVVSYGDTVTCSIIPTKDSTVKYVYTFDKWVTKNGDTAVLTNITSDSTFVASYKSELRKYTIRFYNYDNTILLVLGKEYQTIEYGKSPIFPDIPQREATTKNKFGFDKWYLSGYGEVTDFTVKGDASYYATYISYSIIDSDGGVYPFDIVDNNVVISKDDIANISDMDLTIYFSGVNVYLSENVCNELKDLNSDIKVVVEKSLSHNSLTMYNVLDAQIVDIALYSKDGVVKDFSSIKVSVSCGSNGVKNLQVWEDVNGVLVKVNSRQINGNVEFELSKSSKYIVGVEKTEQSKGISTLGVVLCGVGVLVVIIIIVKISKREEY